ncbi:MAG: DMT family transporter [Paracoccaceae bacterium]
MNPQTQGHAAMLLFSALVAGSFSLGSLAANEIAPMAITAARFCIASVLIGTVVMITGGVPRVALRAPWRYPAMGALMALYFVLMFEGLKTASAVSSAAVFTLTPVAAAVFGWLAMRQQTTPRMALALLIGGIGALWVIFRADWQAFMAFDIGRGEFIFFWGCVSHAFYPVAVRLLNRGERPLVFTFGMLLGGSVILVALAWPTLWETDWANLPPIVWICLGYISVFATAMSFFLVQFSALRLPSAKVMAYTYLTPSWVICWEIALGKDLPPALVLVGVGCTIVALLLLLKNDAPVMTEKTT